MRFPLGDTDQWLGGRGRTLYTLAKVRYVHAGEQPPVAAQLAELAISERTYRTQVAELHRAVQERLEKRLREADRVASGKRKDARCREVTRAVSTHHDLSCVLCTLYLLRRVIETAALKPTVTRLVASWFMPPASAMRLLAAAAP